jgi:hypothetical protein
MRFYGMATCHIQGWVTRQKGAEVASHEPAGKLAERMMA